MEAFHSEQGKRGTGGEGGIRTLGTGVSPYNGLANRRIRPLCHLSGVLEFQFTTSELGGRSARARAFTYFFLAFVAFRTS